MRVTVAHVAAATDGRLVGDGEAVVESVSIDSRTLEPGALFVAVRGERDGHDFVAHARRRGAAAALVERVPGDETGLPTVVVGDTVQALGRWAADHRESMVADVVAVTGSAGKTSTKDLLAAAVATTVQVRASEASFNNELGVPLTVLSAGPDTDVLVVEMGARGPGHIASLCEIARPGLGVLTNVAPAHLEFYDSVEAIAREKASLLEATEVAVVGTDHEWVDLAVGRAGGDVVLVGQREGDDVRYEALELDDELRASFDLRSPWGSARLRLEVRGAHQAANASLAAAAALSLEMPFDAVVQGLADARASRWRMQVERSPAGVIVINDAYNANPTSAAAALDALAALPVGGRRWAVLGEMAELGAESLAEHRALGARAVERGVDRLVVVGERAGAAAEGAREAGGRDVVEVGSAADAARLVADEAQPGDAVLVKGSRVAGLEEVAALLLAHPAVDAP